MSQANANIITAIMQIRDDVAEIKQDLKNLKSRFDEQFGPVVTASDIEEISRRVVKQQGLDRIYVAVDRAKVSEYVNRLGIRTIPATLVPAVGKKSAPLREKYDALLQVLHIRKHGVDVAPLDRNELVEKRKELKRMARKVKLSVIDEDYPGREKEWSNIDAKDKDYYQGLLEMDAHKNGFDIYLCKNMWGARNLLQEACKASRRSEKKKREEAERLNASQNQDDDVAHGMYFEGGESEVSAESPLIEDIFSWAAEQSNSEPPRKKTKAN